MKVTIEEQEWSVRADHGVAVGARSERDHPPVPNPAGLHFVSRQGGHRFLPLDVLALRRLGDLRDLSLEQLVELFHRARPEG